MVVSDAHVFPGSFTPELNQLFFSKATFLTCLRGERRKYAGKKVRLNWVSNILKTFRENEIMLVTFSPLQMFSTISNNKCTI